MDKIKMNMLFKQIILILAIIYHYLFLLSIVVLSIYSKNVPGIIFVIVPLALISLACIAVLQITIKRKNIVNNNLKWKIALYVVLAITIVELGISIVSSF